MPKHIPSRQNSSNRNTSWEPVQKWYKNSVGDEGHYYHQHVVIPGVLRLLELSKQSVEPSFLDIACGQGVLARHLPENVPYMGIDLSPSLVKAAKKASTNPLHQFVVSDVSKPFPIKTTGYTHAAIVLAIQNIEHPELVFKNMHAHLAKGAKVVIVMNHPCFRIPRQTSWQVDQEKKIQYRRIDRYATPMQIPIQAHPSKGEESASTKSFHFSLAAFSKMLLDAGFVITLIEEWCSNKVSTGSAAKMENRSREEFPLFMTLVVRKE